MKKATMTFLAITATALMAVSITSCACLDCNKEFRRVTHELSGPPADPGDRRHY